MATRSNIGIRETDGTINAIYCHWDGYPSHVGRLLRAHYSGEAQVRALLDLGDISSLDKTLETTVAYHRDRGEDKATPIVYAPGRFVRDHAYTYVWNIETNDWLWCHDNELRPLTQADVEE